jgi:putative endonuclease
MRVKEALASAAADQAARYLEGCGFRILDRNWRHEGQIAPVIAADRRALVIIDLRVRAGTRTGTPLHTISDARKNTLRALAARWMAAHGMRYDQIRVDAIGLVQDGTGGFTVEHVKAVG